VTRFVRPVIPVAVRCGAALRDGVVSLAFELVAPGSVRRSPGGHRSAARPPGRWHR